MQTIDIDDYRIRITERQDEDIDHLLGAYYKCEQIHSDNIYVREGGEDFVKQQADAIITNVLHKKIAVRVADCLPIALMGKKYFAIVHAGWKGLKSGILSKTIKMLQVKKEKQIKIFVGPHIKSCCYEVGSEFREHFDAKYLLAKQSKLYLDMIGIVRDTAAAFGIQDDDIIVTPDCTCCSGKHFSYRRGDKDQRIMIAIEKIF
ncbi:MAG: polyphenol oxidase family protein [Candidatus Absconditabacterales bacterium]